MCRLIVVKRQSWRGAALRSTQTVWKPNPRASIAAEAFGGKLAELADLHRNYIGGVERGERNVSLLNIVKLAHGLKVKPTKLIKPIF